MGHIPLLSYAEARSSPETFVASIGRALSSVGFLVLTDIDLVIPTWRSDWDKAFQVTEDFFNLPAEDKRSIAMLNSRHFRGYAGVGDEVTMGKKDLREQIDMGYVGLGVLRSAVRALWQRRGRQALTPLLASSPDSVPIVPYPPNPTDPIENSLYGPNLYPPALPSFAPAIKAYRAHCEAISQDLIAAIAASLTPEPRLLTSLFEEEDPQKPCYSRMKVVRYPAATEEVEGLGVGPHKDGGGLTLLAHDGVPGLQVQRWDGRWEDAEYVPYALVINNGQVMFVCTCSIFLATFRLDR